LIGFSVSELLLRYSNLGTKKYIYYHPTCLHHISYLPVAYEIIFISFRLNKCSIHNYGQINDENHHGGCFYQDIIDTGRLNDNVCLSTIEHVGD